MYTQCPQCQTVFRVTATMLKAARGKVRCGRCAHVFNALTFLLDEDDGPDARSPAAQPAAASPPPAETAAPVTATPQRPHAPAAVKRYDDNTPLEEVEEEQSVEEIILDSGSEAAQGVAEGAGEGDVGQIVLEGADDGSIDEELTLEDAPAGEQPSEDFPEELQAGSPAADELPEETPADEELQLESADETEEDVSDAALEFTAADLSKVFVETPAVSIPHPPPADSGDETAEHEILDVEMETPAPPEVITLEGETVVVAEGDAGDVAALAAAGISEIEPAPPRKPRTPEAIDLEVRREIEKAFADDPTTRAEFILPSGKKVSLHRTQDEIEVEEFEAAEALERDTSRQRRTRIAWGVGGIALAILLGLQVIHYNRQALVQSAQVGPVLTSIYGAFGSELTPAWKVDAYDLRQWGAAADPRTGTVKVRASVTNGAEHAQPYPLLRLTLMNRFGERLRQSDIEPRDYLTQAPRSGQLLGAGQRVDASIAIVDPGDEAVNFEIDVCLRRNAAVTCASDALRQRS